MPFTTLDDSLDRLILKAATALERTLDTSERETARVAAALGILRLAERAARRAEAREKPGNRPARSRDCSRPITTPAPTAPAAPEPTPASADPIPEPEPAPAHTPAPEPSAPDDEPLTPDEIAELTRHFSVLDPARLHDRDLTAYWRGKLRMARRWSCPPAQPPDGSRRPRRSEPPPSSAACASHTRTRTA